MASEKSVFLMGIMSHADCKLTLTVVAVSFGVKRGVK